jgi:hypothetical protein
VSVRGFRDSLRSFVPQWLADRPSLRVGFQLLYTLAGQCDRSVQAAIEGVRAAMPGSDTRTDNLDLLGQSRLLVQGETETAAHFEARLRNWLATARTIGSDAGLAWALTQYLAGNPMVRVISRNYGGTGQSLYTTAQGDADIVQDRAAWNWDGTSNPERAGYWWDYWIVIYVPSVGYYDSTTGHWGDGQTGKGPQGTGIGLYNTRVELDQILSIVNTWKGEHINIRSIIWSYDPDAFSPATPSRSGNPDGTWGYWFNRSTYYASRNRLHRYTSVGV